MGQRVLHFRVESRLYLFHLFDYFYLKAKKIRNEIYIKKLRLNKKIHIINMIFVFIKYVIIGLCLYHTYSLIISGVYGIGSNYEHQSVSNEEISLNIAYRISQSKEYDEYKELGISYDEEKNMFVYQGQTVGYFYDEFGKNQFNRFVNASGEIGIQIIRNSNYKICSIKEVDVDQYRNNDTFAVEQNFEAGEKSKTEEAFELNYLAEEFSLSDYNEFDFEYNESIGCWEYNGKKIKILYDQEKGVCLNQAINDAEAIYIVIERNSDKSSVKEVSYNEMLMLLNNTNFSFDGSGTCIEAN